MIILLQALIIITEGSVWPRLDHNCLLLFFPSYFVISRSVFVCETGCLICVQNMSRVLEIRFFFLCTNKYLFR